MKYLYYICLPIMFYPIYFLVANVIDTLVGEQQLINWLYFDSRLVLLKTFVSDWASSLPVMYAIFYLLILPVALLFKEYFSTSVVFIYVVILMLVAVASYVVGFREFGIIVNSMAVFFMVSLHFLLQSYFLPVLKRRC